jgi:hypothetical protein
MILRVQPQPGAFSPKAPLISPNIKDHGSLGLDGWNQVAISLIRYIRAIRGSSLSLVHRSRIRDAKHSRFYLAAWKQQGAIDSPDLGNYYLDGVGSVVGPFRRGPCVAPGGRTLPTDPTPPTGTAFTS